VKSLKRDDIIENNAANNGYRASPKKRSERFLLRVLCTGDKRRSWRFGVIVFGKNDGRNALNFSRPNRRRSIDRKIDA